MDMDEVCSVLFEQLHSLWHIGTVLFVCYFLYPSGHHSWNSSYCSLQKQEKQDYGEHGSLSPHAASQ